MYHTWILWGCYLPSFSLLGRKQIDGAVILGLVHMRTVFPRFELWDERCVLLNGKRLIEYHGSVQLQYSLI